MTSVVRTRWVFHILLTSLVVLVSVGTAVGWAQPVDTNMDKEQMARARRTRSAVLFIRSQAIEAAIDTNGQFTIGIPNGPILLFGHPNPWSSATTIRIDGVDYWNYDNRSLGTIIEGPRNESDLVNVTKWEIAGIHVVQRLSIVGANRDTVQIAYTVTNRTSQPRDIGVRLMLDTMLGNNDGAPFRVPGAGAVTTEREWLAGQVPTFWQAFDKLDRFTVASQGTLIGGQATVPDRLVVAHWGRINARPWNFTPDPTVSFLDTDSAVGIYWNPVRFLPNQSRTFVTYYGLSALMGAGEDLRVTVPDLPTVYSTDFSIVVYVQAVSAQQDVRVSIHDLPFSVTLAAGETAEKNIGSLSAGEIKDVKWNLRASGLLENIVPEVRVIARARSGIEAAAIAKIPLRRIYTVWHDGYQFANAPEAFNYSFLEFPQLETAKKVFGKNIVGWDVPGFGVRNPLAPNPAGLWHLQRWRFGGWGGSCDGMAATSRLFDAGDLPLPSGARHVIDIPTPGRPSHPVTQLIEEYQLVQYSREWARENSNAPHDVVGVLARVRTALELGEPVVIHVSGPLQGRNAGHALVPWRLVQQATEGEYGEYLIYVYDPNYPRNENRSVSLKLNTQTGFWNWSFRLYEGRDIVWNRANGSIRCMPLLPVYMKRPLTPAWANATTIEGGYIGFGEDWFTIYTETASSIVITDSGGRTAQLRGAEFTTDIPGALHLPLVAVPANPSDYVPPSFERFFVPPSSHYTIRLDGRSARSGNGLNSFWIGGQGRVAEVNASTTSSVAADLLNGSLSFTADLGSGHSNILLYRETTERDFGAVRVDAQVSAGSSINIQHEDEVGGVRVASTGTAATCSVEITTLRNENFGVAAAPSVNVAAGETVRVRLQNPNSPADTPIIIERDRNQDGTFEESTTIGDDVGTHQLPAGISFISLPLAPRDPTWLFLVNGEGNITLASWDAEAGSYSYSDVPVFSYANATQSLSATHSRGFWLRLPNSRTTTLRGTSPERMGISTIRLQRGWNAIGLPMQQALPWSVQEIKVRRGAVEKTLQQAWSEGWIENFAWGWRQNPSDPNTGQYVLIYDRSIMPSAQGELQPWRGYWVYAYQDCEIVLPPRQQSRSRGVPSRNHTSGQRHWTFRVGVRAGNTTGEVLLGGTKENRDIAIGLPPAPPVGGMPLRMVTRKGGVPLAVDVRAEGRSNQPWEIEVQVPPSSNDHATLWWSDVHRVPRHVNPVLVDLQTGERKFLRHSSSHTFAVSREGGTYKFRVELLPQSQLLRIANVRVSGGRSHGSYTISFNTNAAAQVEVRVLSAGRVVRPLLNTVTRSAGIQQVTWDGRDSAGVAVPAGAYLVEIKATSGDGQVTRHTVPLVVTR